MNRRFRPRSSPADGRQRGQGLLAILVILGVAVTALVFYFANPGRLSIERYKKTAAALAQAKEALIGFAASTNITQACAGSNCPRIGDLPCPDLDNDGSADLGSCGNEAGTTGQNLRLGRLPWRTLGLPDLRDGTGERLWYAVSNNFKNNVRTDCSSAGLATCRNSDTRGTITLRDASGAVINDGTNPDQWTPSGAIAVIIAPGAVLQLQGAVAPQDRSCTVGVNCDANERCTTSPASATPKCNPVNYLDVFTGAFGMEDNANFADGSAANGFIQGDVLDASRNVIVNDRLLAIRYEDLMPLLERRVAKEVLNCLNAYAALPQNGGPTNGRYVWAAPIAKYPSYADEMGVRFGRIPDSFGATFLGVGGPVSIEECTDLASPSPLCMSTSWPASCSITTGSWWNNWKELVLYGVAGCYSPADPQSSVLGVPPGGPCSTTCGDCLNVDPPADVDDKRVVVIVAGKRLPNPVGGVSGQQRNWPTPPNKSSPANYVEEDNDGDETQDHYTQHLPTATFNDVLLFQK
jgi:hypothetical protein